MATIDSTRHAPVVEPWEDECPSKQVVGFETFPCFAAEHHSGPHWAMRQTPPCLLCGGYDEHQQRCPASSTTTPNSERFEWTDPPLADVPSEPQALAEQSGDSEGTSHNDGPTAATSGRA